MQYIPIGFRASGVAAGIKKKAGALDVALVTSEKPCNAAATFTINRMKAAPVLRGQQQMSKAGTQLRAVLINAGCANACTGAQGLANAEASAKAVADGLNLLDASAIFTMSTGVIGVQLPLPKLVAGAGAAVQQLGVDGFEAASNAICTTDTVPKTASGEFSAGDKSYKIWGMCKGAGMIHPNMATLLCVIATDAKVGNARLRLALRRVVDRTFNSMTIDGDMSTNDTVLLLANGACGARPDAAEFEAALFQVCASLAQQVARDGEGATKLITINVSGAKSEAQARKIGRVIAVSPLVKTAFFGEDANWGRIVCAAGYSGEAVEPSTMSLWFGGVHVFANGAPTQYSDEAATHAMKGKEVEVHLDLGLGSAKATVWTCDMSHDYVTINGKYRT